jgi:hypothetical protein
MAVEPTAAGLTVGQIISPILCFTLIVIMNLRCVSQIQPWRLKRWSAYHQSWCREWNRWAWRSTRPVLHCVRADMYKSIRHGTPKCSRRVYRCGHIRRTKLSSSTTAAFSKVHVVPPNRTSDEGHERPVMRTHSFVFTVVDAVSLKRQTWGRQASGHSKSSSSSYRVCFLSRCRRVPSL